jgi:hypothetical protein
MNLYRVEMSDHGGTFFVVAEDPTRAALAAEQQWRTWSYPNREGSVVAVHLAAVGDQYPPKGIPWLLVAGPKKDGRRAGGLARTAAMSPEQRTEFARKGAKARWSTPAQDTGEG